MPRLNRTYLQDRVWKVAHEKQHEIHEQQAEGVGNIIKLRLRRNHFLEQLFYLDSDRLELFERDLALAEYLYAHWRTHSALEHHDSCGNWL